MPEGKNRRSFTPPCGSGPGWIGLVPILTLVAIGAATYIWIWPVIVEFLRHCASEFHTPLYP